MEFGSGSRSLAQFRTGSRVLFSTLKRKEITKNNFREEQFSFKNNLFLNYKKIINFTLYFILYLHVWIWIHKALEYGSNSDPDPQRCIIPILVCLQLVPEPAGGGLHGDDGAAPDHLCHPAPHPLLHPGGRGHPLLLTRWQVLHMYVGLNNFTRVSISAQTKRIYE